MVNIVWGPAYTVPTQVTGEQRRMQGRHRSRCRVNSRRRLGGLTAKIEPENDGKMAVRAFEINVAGLS